MNSDIFINNKRTILAIEGRTISPLYDLAGGGVSAPHRLINKYEDDDDCI